MSSLFSKSPEDLGKIWTWRCGTVCPAEGPSWMLIVASCLYWSQLINFFYGRNFCHNFLLKSENFHNWIQPFFSIFPPLSKISLIMGYVQTKKISYLSQHCELLRNGLTRRADWLIDPKARWSGKRRKNLLFEPKPLNPIIRLVLGC